MTLTATAKLKALAGNKTEKKVGKKPAKRAVRAVAVVAEDTQPAPKKKDVAYTVEDKIFGTFEVLASANAWWVDSVKLKELINAFKYDATHEEASIAAGISLDQLRYFLEKHPDFYPVIDACRQIPTLSARQTVVHRIKEDGNLAFKYLERKRPGEFGQKPPQVNLTFNMASKVADDREEYSK